MKQIRSLLAIVAIAFIPLAVCAQSNPDPAPLVATQPDFAPADIPAIAVETAAANTFDIGTTQKRWLKVAPVPRSFHIGITEHFESKMLDGDELRALHNEWRDTLKHN